MLEKLKALFGNKKQTTLNTPILIIDDDEATRFYLRTILEKSQFKVVEAENAYGASVLLSKNNIDLVITDIVMPGKNGLDLIIDICRQKPDLHVIAMSGARKNGYLTNLDAAELIGAQITLAKPFTKKQLLSSIEEALS
jgi:DNA-binding NtrC family response regulator